MANSTDKSILTAAGKALLAQLNAEEKALVIDKMIFANVPNRPEYPQPDDVVPTDHIVHQEQVEQRGRLSADSVIYSTTLTSDVGPFDFNWTGAYCSEYGVLVTIDHHALTPKTADEPGVAGNTLVRSVVLEYKDIAEITNITVDASSWQYNATERMKKMDSDVAQSIIDQNGKDWFIEDGFLVTPSGSAYSIKAGAGYVSGNRVAMEFDRSVQVPNKPSFIYIDAHREGTPTGEQVTLFNFVVTAEEKDDYIDSSTGKDVKHFVCKIAQVHADGSVSDLRPKESVARKEWVKKIAGDEWEKGKVSIPGRKYNFEQEGKLPRVVITNKKNMEMGEEPDANYINYISETTQSKVLNLEVIMCSDLSLFSHIEVLSTGLLLKKEGTSSPSLSFNDNDDGYITDRVGNKFIIWVREASISSLMVGNEKNVTNLFVGAVKKLKSLNLDVDIDINQAVVESSSCSVYGVGIISNIKGGSHRMLTVINSDDLTFSNSGFNANLDNVTKSISKLDPVISVQNSNRVKFNCSKYKCGSVVHGVVSFILFTDGSKHCKILNAEQVEGVRTLGYWRKGCHYPYVSDIFSEDLGLQLNSDHLIDFEADINVVMSGELDNRNNWITEFTIFGGKIRRVNNIGKGQAYQMTGATVNCQAYGNKQLDSWEEDSNTAGFKFDRVGPECSSKEDYYSGKGIGINDQNINSYGIEIKKFSYHGTDDTVSSIGIRSGFSENVRGKHSSYEDVYIYGKVNVGILTTQPGVSIRRPNIVARTPIDSGVDNEQREVNNLRIDGGELTSTHQHALKGNSTGSSIKDVIMRGYSISAMRFIKNADMLRISGNQFMNGDGTDRIELISAHKNTGCVVAYNPGLRLCDFNNVSNTVILDEEI